MREQTIDKKAVAAQRRANRQAKEEAKLQAGRIEQLQQRQKLLIWQENKLQKKADKHGKKQEKLNKKIGDLKRQQQTLTDAIIAGGGGPQHHIEIPAYRLSEELLAAISHGMGALFGALALVLCVLKAVANGDVMQVVCGAIYGGSLVLLYTVSTLYHALAVNGGKRVFRVLDHCTIYLLIAGTYTPFTLVALGQNWIGWSLFLIVWAAGIVGIVFSAIDLHKYRKLAMVAYLCMGWVIILAIRPLLASMAIEGFWFLLAGGIAYTIGAVLYGLGKKIPYMHAVFHFFVVAGSILHFLSLYFYVFL